MKERMALTFLVALASLASASAGAGELPAGYTLAMVRGATTQDLAVRFLGEMNAETIERHEIEDPIFENGPLSGIRFYARPRPLDATYCRQAVHRIGFSLIARQLAPGGPVDLPTHVSSMGIDARVARAPGCEMAPGQEFVRAGGGVTTQDIVVALDALSGIRDAARARGTLPFSLTCDAYEQRECRPLLAGLPIEQAWLMRERNSLLIGIPGARYTEVRFDDLGTPQARVAITRGIPAPF